MLKRYEEFIKMNDEMEELDINLLKTISEYSKAIGGAYVENDVAEIMLKYIYNVSTKKELELKMLMSKLCPVDDLNKKVEESSNMDKEIMNCCKSYINRPNCDIKVLRIIDTITDSLMMHNKMQLLILGQPIQE